MPTFARFGFVSEPMGDGAVGHDSLTRTSEATCSEGNAWARGGDVCRPAV